MKITKSWNVYRSKWCNAKIKLKKYKMCVFSIADPMNPITKDHFSYVLWTIIQVLSWSFSSKDKTEILYKTARNI